MFGSYPSRAEARRALVLAGVVSAAHLSAHSVSASTAFAFFIPAARLFAHVSAFGLDHGELV
jgi:hypothetical protein